MVILVYYFTTCQRFLRSKYSNYMKVKFATKEYIMSYLLPITQCIIVQWAHRNSSLCGCISLIYLRIVLKCPKPPPIGTLYVEWSLENDKRCFVYVVSHSFGCVFKLYVTLVRKWKFSVPRSRFFSFSSRPATLGSKDLCWRNYCQIQGSHSSKNSKNSRNGLMISNILL